MRHHPVYRHSGHGYLYFLIASCIWFFFLAGFGPPRLVDRENAPTVRLNTGALRSMAEAVSITAPPASEEETAGAEAPASESAPSELTTVSAGSLLVFDVDAGRTLFEREATQPRPPASLTKLMTALLVLEANDLNTRVTVQGADLVGGATMGLQAGESLTVEQLLRGLLIPSGNDAAMALARHTAGDVETFVQRMNARAAELGLEQTHFVNPHGLDAAGHESSAADLLRLALELRIYPLFREITATESANVAGHSLQNTNELLGTFEGADGMKTGTTDRAGECLIASITRNGHTVLIVLLGSTDRYGDARTLYESYQDQFDWVDGGFGSTAALNRVRDGNGNIWYLRTAEPPLQILQQRWGEAPLQAFRRLELPPSGALWQPDMYAGVVEWRQGDTLIGTQALELW